MINSTLTNQELQLLSSFIGKSLISVIRTEKDSYNRVFGNIAINVGSHFYEIRNELTVIDYFGGKEDVSRFYVKKLESKECFDPMVVLPIEEMPINETIIGISIIRDMITVKNSAGNTIYEISMDDAIIIKTEKSVYAISREWSLEEEMIIVKTTDYLRDIYSVEQIVCEWSDEDDNSVATCTRTEISLSKKNEEAMNI